jgi:ATP-dependent DNA helicase RecQ
LVGATPDWSERSARPGWELLFTNVGGRLRTDDPLERLGDADRLAARRVLSQACFAVSRTGAALPEDPDIDFWATVCRKILQRGMRPPLSPRLDEAIRSRLEPDVDRYDTMSTIRYSKAPFELAGSYELHPRWEAPFWQAVQRLAPEAACWLLPQASLDILAAGQIPAGVGRRWVDFLYCPPGRAPIVFEIDGAGHERRADADRARDLLLRAAGISVRRASGPDSINPNGEFLTELRRDAVQLRGCGGSRDALLAHHGPGVPGRFATAVVEAVARGYLPKGGPWGIEVVDELDLVGDVAGGALDLLRAASEIWGLRVVPSTVTVNGRVWQLSGSDPRIGHTPRATTPTIRIRLQPWTPYWAAMRDTADLPEIVIRRVGIPTDLRWLPQVVQSRRSLSEHVDVATHLRVLLVDLFGHEGFREGQEDSLRQALAGRDAVVLLPTGSGKSLIYQLAGLLIPGATLVIDPLVSLIDDQEERLLRDGIDRVVGLHSGRMDDSNARDKALHKVSSGEAIFIFLTPERFQSQRFRDHLRETAREVSVNLAVIDEAHCVSEWGHDFRTSYLRLARNIRRLCSDRNHRPPPLLALTGTASPAVLRDVLRELDIDGEADGALQRPSSYDRKNLTFMKRTAPEAQWCELVVDAIMQPVPKHLGIGLAALADLDGSKTYSGVVFSPHVNGKHGIAAIRDEIIGGFGARGIAIDAEMYAGGAPSGDGDERDWAQKRSAAANRFKDNKVPLLIGTKAFGMGIDKQNIRYTVHAGFPSSIEAFAQEAGRAGRSGIDPALCVLTAALSAPGVAERLLDLDVSPEERKSLAKKTRDDQGGDLKRQLFFLGKSFPGETEEVSKTTSLFNWMLRRGGVPGGEVVIPLRPRPYPVGTMVAEERSRMDPRRWAEEQRSLKEAKRLAEEQRSRVDRALYRLAMIGVVDDVTIDGPEVTVHFARYDCASIDAAYAAYASMIEPGNEKDQREALLNAPDGLDERVEHHVRLLTAMVYRIVVRARLMALRNMYQLTIGPDDDEHIRTEINNYLGEGPAAAVLSEAVSRKIIDLPRFIAALKTLPAQDVRELAGATARQLEAYPDHPLLWFSRALASARGADDTQAEFADALQRSLSQLSAYRVGAPEAADAVQWLADRLRNENGGRRWNWIATILEAWDATAFAEDLLVPIEKQALERAESGEFNTSELIAIGHRRFRRRGREAARLADRFNPAATSSSDERE